MITKLKKSDLKLSAFINIILLILLCITLTIGYFRFESIKNQINEKNFAYQLENVAILASQIDTFMMNIFLENPNLNTLNSNKTLQEKINLYLHNFTSKQYKNIFVLSPPKKGSIAYTIIGNGTSFDEEFSYGEVFEPYSENWNRILKTKKVSYFKKGVKGIWFTYQHPILEDDTLIAIITIDFSLENYKYIQEHILVMKNALDEYLLVMLIVICFLVILSIMNFVHIKREKNLLDILKVENKKLEEEKLYMKTLQDINPNMLVIFENQELTSVNKAFLEFFCVKDIASFTSSFESLNKLISSIDDKALIDDDIFWTEYLYANKKQTHILKLNKHNKTYYFYTVAASLSERKTLIVFQDITELESKNKMLLEESKLISMAELLQNISHQWKQPLSTISAASSGIKMQKEYGVLGDEDLFETCDTISDNAIFLSKTIDSFHSLFANTNETPTTFSLNKTIKETLLLLEQPLKKHNIEVILNVQKKIRVYGKQAVLKQSLLNILNNSIDILEKNNKKKSIIVIYSTLYDSNAVIRICDNGEGIDEQIMDKIFEPYFTTKHQAQGTGLGLYFTYNNIVKVMNGSIKVKNGAFEHKKKRYQGAEFIIKLPTTQTI